MYASAQTFQLKPGCYDEYKKAHDELWPELVDAFNEHGISMLIYHYKDRLFLYAMAPSKEAMERSHPKEVGERWSAYMASMMICDDEGKAVVEDMDAAFLFGEFAKASDE